MGQITQPKAVLQFNAHIVVKTPNFDSLSSLGMDWVCPWQGELDAGVRVPNIVGPHRLTTHSKGHQYTKDEPAKSGQRRPEWMES